MKRLAVLTVSWLLVICSVNAATTPKPSNPKPTQSTEEDHRDNLRKQRPRSIISEITNFNNTQRDRNKKTDECDKRGNDGNDDNEVAYNVPYHCAQKCDDEYGSTKEHVRGICTIEQIEKAFKDKKEYRFLDMRAKGALPWICDRTGGSFEKYWDMEQVKEPGLYGILATAILGLLYSPVETAMKEAIKEDAAARKDSHAKIKDLSWGSASQKSTIIPYCIIRSPGKMTHFGVVFKTVPREAENTKAQSKKDKADIKWQDYEWNTLSKSVFMDTLVARLSWDDAPPGGHMNLSEYPVFLPIDCFRGFYTPDMRDPCSETGPAYLREVCPDDDDDSNKPKGCAIFDRPRFDFKLQVEGELQSGTISKFKAKENKEMKVNGDNEVFVKRLLDRPLAYVGLIIKNIKIDWTPDEKAILNVMAVPDTRLIAYTDWEARRLELRCLLSGKDCVKDIHFTLDDILPGIKYQDYLGTSSDTPKISYPLKKNHKGEVCDGQMVSVQSHCPEKVIFKCRDNTSDCQVRKSSLRFPGLSRFIVTFSMTGKVCKRDLSLQDMNSSYDAYFMLNSIEAALINLTLGNAVTGDGPILYVACINPEKNESDPTLVPKMGRFRVDFVAASSEVRWSTIRKMIMAYFESLASDPANPPRMIEAEKEGVKVDHYEERIKFNPYSSQFLADKNKEQKPEICTARNAAVAFTSPTFLLISIIFISTVMAFINRDSNPLFPIIVSLIIPIIIVTRLFNLTSPSS